MGHRTLFSVAVVSIASFAFAQTPPTTAPGGPPPPPAAPQVAPIEAASRVVAVTVYQGTALVSREVQVPAGGGQVELVVRDLPPQAIDSSLYTEGGDGVRVLSTRIRTRAVRDDTRAEVRAKEQQIRELQARAEAIQRQTQVVQQNLQLLDKLEGFTAVTMKELAERGLLSAEATLSLTKFVMDDRVAKATQQIALQQELAANQEATAFAQRELAELTAGSSRTERDAVIVLDKPAAGAAGAVRLNYLVSSATWQAQYRLRANGDAAPVQIEYLAAVEQQSGEDWRDVSVVLSNAQPMLNADPPELLALEVATTAVAAANEAPQPQQYEQRLADLGAKSKQLRQQAQVEALRDNRLGSGAYMNAAAAAEQAQELFAEGKDLQTLRGGFGSGGPGSHMPGAPRRLEGPTVTYHLGTRYTVPSRNDQQLIEVARLELAPDYFYKAVPVLTPHVYRLARLQNTSDRVLLNGEATMYLGSDFVGRMQMPLVAIGAHFTVGFGVDPQIQVERELVDKKQTIQGGNQVHTFDYRIRVSSFKREPVKLQVWDRMPKGDTQAVGVSFVSSTQDLSTDADYVRAEKPKNLLRWDLTVPANTHGEQAPTIAYQFKLEYDRGVQVSGFEAHQ